MDKKGLLKKINELILYIVVIELLLFGSVWNMFPISGIPYLALYWGFVLLGLLKLCLQNHTWKDWVWVILFGIISILSFKESQDKTPLLLMLGVSMAKDVDVRKLMKIDMISRILITIMLIIIPMMGLAENHIHVWHTGRYRDYFGWEAPNGMGFMILVICMEWMYLKHREFKWYDYLGMLSVVLFLDQTANSRFAELLIIGIILVELLSQLLVWWKIPVKEISLWFLGCIGALLLAVIAPVTGVLLYHYQNPVFMSLTGSLFARFQIPGAFYEAHGLSLFGSPYNPEIYDYLDMSFGYLALHLGLMIAIIVLVIMIKAIIYGYQRNDERYLLFLMFILLRCILESEHFTLVYAFFPVFLGVSVWNNKKECV